MKPQVAYRLGKFEIGRILHLKSRNPKYRIGQTRALNLPVGAQQKKADEIQQRLIHSGASACREDAPTTVEGRYISQQLIRSGLSAAKLH